MEVKAYFDHFNVNVTDLDKSVAFYKAALGLEKVGEIIPESGEFKIFYMSDAMGKFRLELTWLRDKAGQYELGDNESHLCMRVDGDYDEIRKFHKENGWVCYENEEMGLYFINDPDDYWIEILPLKK